ncbi:MAG: LacI family DNA-binding transcriptional regulator [Bacillota bacterium]
MNIREIAEQAKVSITTVSRYINHPERLSASMREYLADVLKDFEYMPNPTAQSLSTGITRTIACLVPTLRNMQFHDEIEGCQNALNKEGYRALIYAQHRNEQFWNKFDQRGVDGIILSGLYSLAELIDEIQRIKIPYVLIENPGYIQALKAQPTCVYVDDAKGITMALEHLYGTGARKFAIIAGDPRYFVTQRRMSAMHTFFDRHSDCVWKIEYGDYSDAKLAQIACARLLEDGTLPDAVLAMNDMMAAGALKMMLSKGIRIPEEIALMGIDDNSLAPLLTPALSTVHLPSVRIGKKAAELVLAKIRGEHVPSYTSLPLSLCLRETTR